MKFPNSVKIIALVILFSFGSSVLSHRLKNPNIQQQKGKSDNPFQQIGLEELNPKKILDELDNEYKPKSVVKELTTIQDLPEFVKNSPLSDEEVLDILSRFLLQDDIALKQYGAIYDKSGFEGVPEIKSLPDDPQQAAIIKARSAANLYVSLSFNNTGKRKIRSR